MITVSAWFIWFLVACGVGVVTTITSSIISYNVGASQRSKADEAQKAQEQELRSREKNVRESANQLAEKTSEHVEALVEQSRAQNEVVATQNTRLTATVTALKEVQHKIPQSAESLEVAAQSATKTIASASLSTQETKSVLEKLNQELEATQSALQEKEKALEQALTRLNEMGASLQNSATEGQTTLNTVGCELKEIKQIVSTEAFNEVTTMRAENARMHKDIHTLEEKVSALTLRMKKMMSRDDSQVKAIESLKSENLKLKEEMKCLIEHVNAHVSRADSAAAPKREGLRLFA